MAAAQNARDPVVDYLNSLHWDGKPRLDTLFIDYLGAEDTAYCRAVARKCLVAAVARALQPGYKYDQVVIFSGVQGIGKSTFLRKLGRKWFSDSITNFQGKDARESLRGVWIVELGELTALDKSESEAAKQFISSARTGTGPATARTRSSTRAGACSLVPATRRSFCETAQATVGSGPSM